MATVNGVAQLEGKKAEVPLGRHTRLAIPFQWKGVDGALIDLETNSYTAEVWVSQGTTVNGPFTATVSGDTATYQIGQNDLAEATATNAPVAFTCVAENATNVLPPNMRRIVVAEWGGADEYPGTS